MAYYAPPSRLPGFPGYRNAKRKTPLLRGAPLRKRWKNAQGRILEWDYRHGVVEAYNKQGRHLGEFDPETGDRLSQANPSRRIEP